MRIQLLPTILLGGITVACALPLNASISGNVDDIAYTAGDGYPDAIASDEIWDKYQKKGNHYQCLFEANDEGAGYLIEDKRTPPSAQSVWKGDMIGDRRTWNWHENRFDEDNCNAKYLGLEEAFDALKLNAFCENDEDDKGQNVGSSLGHYDEDAADESDPNGYHFKLIPPICQTYVVDGKTYKSTGAYYTFFVNQVDGAIMALDIESPLDAIRTHWSSIGGTAKSEDLPALRYMSDLVWGKYVEGNPNVKNLHAYVVHNILNDETSAIVSRVLRNKQISKLSVWPGIVLDKDKDPVEFQATIGSPIGGTMAILLAQHKAELGPKEIYQVNIVTDVKSIKGPVPDLHLFFQIREIPPPKPESKRKEDKQTDAGAIAIARRDRKNASTSAVNTGPSNVDENVSIGDSQVLNEEDGDKVQTGLEWKNRRTADDVTWKKYIDKGKHFTCLMRASSEGAQKLTEGSTPVDSPWTGTLDDELKMWGWHEGHVETDFDCDFERLHFKEVFSGLGLDAKPSLDEYEKPAAGHNTCFRLQHFDTSLKDPNGEELDLLEQPYIAEGVTHYATGAYYNFGVNSEGAIIGIDLLGPKYAVTQRDSWNREANPDELPALRHISDMYWAYWHRLASNPKNLHYYIATHVVNDNTVKLVARALENIKMNDLSEWPGITFKMGSEEWAALVGSPIGGSLAALLFQHKVGLGLKYVTEVTIVYDSNPERTRDHKRYRPWLHMVFRIDDVPITTHSVQNNSE